MNKAGLAFAALVCCLLLFYVVVVNIFILPVFQSVFAETHRALLLPTRVAFLFMGKGGIQWVPVLVIVLLVVGYLRVRGGGDAARMTALNAANLLLVLYVVVQGAVWLDMAIAFPRLWQVWQPAPAATQPALPSAADSARPPAR